MNDFLGMLNPVARWLHIIAGVMWIGLLYFFNFQRLSDMMITSTTPHQMSGKSHTSGGVEEKQHASPP